MITNGDEMFGVRQRSAANAKTQDRYVMNSTMRQYIVTA